MTKTQVPRVTPEPGLGSAWTGWAIFASVMLVVVGVVNIIQGLVALFEGRLLPRRAAARVC